MKNSGITNFEGLRSGVIGILGKAPFAHVHISGIQEEAGAAATAIIEETDIITLKTAFNGARTASKPSEGSVKEVVIYASEVPDPEFETETTLVLAGLIRRGFKVRVSSVHPWSSQ